MHEHDTPDQGRRGGRALVRGLGWASLGLAVPLLTRPERVAEVTGLDDDRLMPRRLRGVGAREALHAGLLLAAPGRSAWTRVAGDAMDLAMLRKALLERSGSRRRRTAVATAAVAGIAGLDLWAALRSGRASRPAQHGRGRPGPLALRASATVATDPREAYRTWRDLEGLPRFMRHLESVSENGDGTSTWTATAPFGRTVSWRAELTGDEPGRRLSWRSLPGADVDNSGTVHFAEAPGGGTEVSVRLHFDVPGGKVGLAVAKLFGEEPEQQVRDDLRRFKMVVETGDVVRSDALPDGPDARHQAASRPAQPVGGKDVHR